MPLWARLELPNLLVLEFETPQRASRHRHATLRSFWCAHLRLVQPNRCRGGLAEPREGRLRARKRFDCQIGLRWPLLSSLARCPRVKISSPRWQIKTRPPDGGRLGKVFLLEKFSDAPLRAALPL